MAGNIASDSPIAEELADVLSYVLAFANAVDIDLDEAIRRKMIKNAIKYPAPRLSDTGATEQSTSS